MKVILYKLVSFLLYRQKTIIDLLSVLEVNQFPQPDGELSFSFSVDVPTFDRN